VAAFLAIERDRRDAAAVNVKRVERLAVSGERQAALEVGILGPAAFLTLGLAAGLPGLGPRLCFRRLGLRLGFAQPGQVGPVEGELVN
jgi:hypothetical protein